MKTQAKVAVIGGGIMGVSTLYYLAKEGWTDAVLIEKSELTSGSTWHAAGLLPHFIGSLSMAKIHQDGIDLYGRLPELTQQASGFHPCGSLRLALSRDEVDWFHYVSGILEFLGVEHTLLPQNQLHQVHPLLNVNDVRLGFYVPGDGHTDPSSVTMGIATLAKQLGAQIVRHNRVTAMHRNRSGEWKLETEKGSIIAEHVVNACGCYANQVAQMIGVSLPIVNMIHQYLVTEPIDAIAQLDTELPVVRDPRSSCYIRQEQQGALIGPYETEGAQAWALDGVDWGFDRELLQPDIERLSPWIEKAMERLPCSAQAGIKSVVSGPITHTPDSNFLMGPLPGWRNYWLNCGAGIGITQGVGAGKYLAQWMVHGQTEINPLELSPARFGSWATPSYTLAKCIDEYEHMYTMAYPGESRESGRPVRTSPLHERMVHAKARFAEVAGWERTQWFSQDHSHLEQYSYKRNNVFDTVANECHAVRDDVALADLSSFTKLELNGPDAAAHLGQLLCTELPQKGRARLSYFLTHKGYIHSEMTVARVADQSYYLVSASAAENQDDWWILQYMQDNVKAELLNHTASRGILAVTGPNSRALLEQLTATSLDFTSFPWLGCQNIYLAGCTVLAMRVSYAGESGWELHAAREDIKKIYAAIVDLKPDIAHLGTYAMNSLRLEKAWPAWGSELTVEVTPDEAGLARMISKKRAFKGSDALKRAKPRIRLIYLQIQGNQDRDAGGNEPVYCQGRVVGITTSGGFGHRTGTSLAFAYVDEQYAQQTQFQVKILDERYEALKLTQGVWDPQHQRMTINAHKT